MIKRLGLTESIFEEGLKKAGVWIPCGITRSPILFPVTTNSGKSYDMGCLSMLQTLNTDPLTIQPLTGIYYNQTLFSIIYHSIRDQLEQDRSLPELKKQAFIVEWMKINRSLHRNLHEKRLIGKQSEKKELPLFATVSSIIAALAYIGRFALPNFIIPFACAKDLGGWQNPLPQLCADLESVLQLTTKGFQGAFDYGLKSASECIKLYTPEECNSHAMKSASLNNPLGRSRDLQAVSLEKAEDSFLMIMLSMLIGPLLLLLLLQMTLLGTKLLIGNRERKQDVSDALGLIEQADIKEVEEAETGLTLQQLKERYQEIQSQPNAERDKASVISLCTGCSYSYFGEDKHRPCAPGAELIIDYDTAQLLAERPR